MDVSYNMMMPEFSLEPPPYNLMLPLLELQDHYACLLEDYERKASMARSQLEHIEALLSHWSLEKPAEITASATDENLLLVDQTAATPNIVEESSTDEVANNFVEESVSEEEFSEPEQLNSEVDRPAESRQPVMPIAVNHSFNKVIDFPMVHEYQSMTRMEAIDKLLQNNIGTVCHIDFIVRSLYGDLEPKLFKVIKGRVHSSLTHGKEKNYWASIPDEPGCYTLDISLVKSSSNKQQSRSIKNKKRKPFILPRTKRVPMLPGFEGQFLIDAIASFLEKNPRKTFSVAEIISGVYGDLDAEQLREIKSPVLNELSRGYRIGRFSRVPNKVGYYCWDSKA